MLTKETRIVSNLMILIHFSLNKTSSKFEESIKIYKKQPSYVFYKSFKKF